MEDISCSNLNCDEMCSMLQDGDIESPCLRLRMGEATKLLGNS